MCETFRSINSHYKSNIQRGERTLGVMIENGKLLLWTVVNWTVADKLICIKCPEQERERETEKIGKRKLISERKIAVRRLWNSISTIGTWKRATTQNPSRNKELSDCCGQELTKSCVMLLTIIVFYSFIIRCLKRENKLVAPERAAGLTSSASVTSTSIASNSTSSSTTTSLAYNHFNKSQLKDAILSNRDKEDRVPVDKHHEKDNPNDSGKEPYSDEEVADDNQFDEEEFYNIIATKAAAFQSKRNSSTSTVSSGSIYEDTYRTKRNSLRSQSSTCSDVMETSTTMSNRRSSEDRVQNRKLNYKMRRHGFGMSKRRRTTGRYF